MAAVGPDSLATATAMPSMSVFTKAGLSLGHPKHIGSVAGSSGSEDIFRAGGFHCARTEQFVGICCPSYIQLGDMQRGGLIAPRNERSCGCTASRRYNYTGLGHPRVFIVVKISRWREFFDGVQVDSARMHRVLDMLPMAISMIDRDLVIPRSATGAGSEIKTCCSPHIPLFGPRLGPFRELVQLLKIIEYQIYLISLQPENKQRGRG